MPIQYIHREPEALEKKDNISDPRELYVDNLKIVPLTFEMDHEEAWDFFNLLPEHILPPLPEGHQWVQANDNYSIVRNRRSEEHDITIVLYGPDKTNYINFICRVDDVTTYSFGQTKKGAGPSKRTYPMTLDDFRVIGYDYSGKKYRQHVRGHLIDHQDSILGVPTVSTYDSRNFVPEPPVYEWGLGFRRLKVQELRNSGGGAYAQFNSYSDKPLITKNGTPVPDDVRFYAYNKEQGYTAKEVFHVEFEENMFRQKGTPVLTHAAENFMSSLAASPVVATYDPDVSDRGLRLQYRNLSKKEQSISDEKVVSRFIKKDQRIAACAAADVEFESAGLQFHAGAIAQRKKTSLSYVKRALFFGGQLEELDDDTISVFNRKEIVEARTFFKRQDSVDMEALEDEFEQLCSDL
jgi:hypothetical protein